MQSVQVWSEGKDEFVMLSVDDAVHKKLTDFCTARAADSKFFSSVELNDLCPDELYEQADTGTAAFMVAFTPDGYGATQHSYDDFAVEKSDNAE